MKKIIILIIALVNFSCAQQTVTKTEIEREPQAIFQPSTNTHNPQIAGPNNCKNAKFPNPKLTPGSVFPHVTVKQLCTPGYTSTVRNVADSIARQAFKNYGIESKFTTKERANYEVDHLISLELGGDNDIKNLWPQKYEPKPGARQKDVVETSLHRRICNGELTISQAQDIITGNWCDEYLNITSKLLK